jgi:hypothetical protein
MLGSSVAGVLPYISTKAAKSEAEGATVRTRLIFPTVVLILMVALSPATRGQSSTSLPSPTPDISGVWLLEKYQPALFPKGGAPLQPWAEEKFKAANPQTNDPNLACLPEGVPRFMFVPLPMEIFQVPTRVVILHEGIEWTRQIYMNRQHLKDLDPSYSGDSIGKWEGDTLVLDTIGFKDSTWVDAGGLPHSEAMHLVERIRRTDHDTLVDDFTIDDPKAYTKPIRTQRTYKLKPGWEIQEYVCEENNKYSHKEK